MSERTRLGLYVFGGGLLLGLMGDLLLRATPWGLNVALWVGALVAIIFLLKRQADYVLKRADDLAASAPSGRAASGFAFRHEGAWALPCAFLFAAAFAWRDSLTLQVINAAVILALLSVALLGQRGGRVLRAGVTDYWLAGAVSALSTIFAPLLLLFSDIKWKEMPRSGWSRHTVAVMRGLLIAVPLLLIFGGLFAAADAVYEGLLRNTFNLDPDVAVSHIFLFLFLAWMSAGYLRAFFLSRAGERAGILNRNSVVVLGLSGTSAREGVATHDNPAAPYAGVNESNRMRAGASFTTTERAADARAQSGTASDDYRPQPPSVTELHDEHTPHVPQSVVSEPPPVTAQATGNEAARDVPTGDAASSGDAATSTVTTSAVKSGTGASGFSFRPSLGIVEVAIVLGLLNVLFLSFVAVQLRYFFGGASLVAESVGMTYSEYARRGFFELVWVAALVLPLLLVAHWLLRREKPSHERIFKCLAAGLVLMLFVVMASALGRMRLYQSEYGQTELRFYTTAFMGWLALVFVWFSLTVLRGRREWFAFGSMIAALIVACLLNAANPDALIVRANGEHARERGNFDAAYATALSADSIPALLEAAPALRPQDRAEVARRLLERVDDDDSDWRSWNLSRAQARRAVHDSKPRLLEWAQTSPTPEAVMEVNP